MRCDLVIEGNETKKIDVSELEGALEGLEEQNQEAGEAAPKSLGGMNFSMKEVTAAGHEAKKV